MLDKNDLTSTQFNDLKKKSVKIIDFRTSYDLCPQTPNSFNVANDYPTDIIQATPLTKMGKLTLNSVKVYGRGGADMILLTNFNYDVTENLERQTLASLN